MTRARPERFAVFVLGATLAVSSAACGGATGPKRPTGPIDLRLDAIDGGAVDIRSYRGRPVVLHVFTTWSLAAQNDIPHVIEAHAALARDVVFVGLALDPDGHRLVAPWRDANQIAYLIATPAVELMSGSSSLGRIDSVPTTIVLAADGTIAHWFARPLKNDELLPLLRGMLAGQ